ncbi:NfeD family protein [Peptococcaceae bacterium 1198_IL3148]
MSNEIAVWVAVLVMILGVLSLIMEVFVFPGFGFSGIAGVLLLAWGIILLSTDLIQSLQSLVIGLILTIAFFAWGIRMGYKRKLWHRFALKDRQAREQGYSSARQELKQLLGKEGVVISKLRPSGAVEIEGQRIDVVSEGGYIMPGTKIVVVRVEGSRVVVKEI